MSDDIYFQGKNFSLTKEQYTGLFTQYSIDGNDKKFWSTLSRWDDESILPLTFGMLQARLSRAWRYAHEQGREMGRK